jgi:hypothetical protein
MTNHAPGGGMTADEFEDVLREYESEATDSVMAYERGSGSHKGHDERASLYRRQLIDAYSAALQRAEAAEAIVAKLPKTADNVVAFPGDKLYWWDGTVLLEGILDQNYDPVFQDPNPPGWRFHPNAGLGACYSTREAALAAAGEGGGTKA